MDDYGILIYANKSLLRSKEGMGENNVTLYLIMYIRRESRVEEKR